MRDDGVCSYFHEAKGYLSGYFSLPSLALYFVWNGAKRSQDSCLICAGKTDPATSSLNPQAHNR